MGFELRTSLYLSNTTSPTTSNDLINLDLVLDRSSSSSSPSSPMSLSEQRVFSCTYCKKKFFSSQALGGHQNAHRIERTLAKKSREQLNMTLKPHHSSPSAGTQHEIFSYGRKEIVRHDSSQEEMNHLDLSLRL